MVNKLTALRFKIELAISKFFGKKETGAEKMKRHLDNFKGLKELYEDCGQTYTTEDYIKDHPEFQAIIAKM